MVHSTKKAPCGGEDPSRAGGGIGTFLFLGGGSACGGLLDKQKKGKRLTWLAERTGMTKEGRHQLVTKIEEL